MDAYNPTLEWFDTDVVGIDVGITLLSAENLLTGDVWRWFMANKTVPHAMDLIGFSEPPSATSILANAIEEPLKRKRARPLQPRSRPKRPPARHPLFQQKLRGLHQRIVMKAFLHPIPEQRVVDRQQRHPLVMRHETADHFRMSPAE